MLIEPLALVYAVLLVCAIIFASFAPKDDRREAQLLALLLLVNWVSFVATYTPYSPARALGMRPQDWWAMMDGLCGVVAMLAFQRWWGWALWAISILQEILHAGHDFGWYDQFTYTDYLDSVLRAQIALFFLIGGRGVGDFLYRGVDRIRRRRGPRRALARLEKAEPGA
jgi:hypothetical protein